jgi:hypothetical protein
MFGAKRNGKRKVDLPSVSKNQIVNKIGMKRFAICPVGKIDKNHSRGELLTLKSI